MQLIINGEKHEVAVVTVAELLEHLGVEPDQAAVERNRVIVSKSRYTSEALMEGDEIEIVEFIGGG